MGVPYTPRVDNHAQGTGKKVLIDIPDTTPRPTVKPKDAESVDKDIFVDLSPLATSVGVIEKQNEREDRDPMDFTPPPFNLGIDLSQSKEPVDAIPVSYAFPSQPDLMMAQPILDGRNAVKFASRPQSESSM